MTNPERSILLASSLNATEKPLAAGSTITCCVGSSVATAGSKQSRASTASRSSAASVRGVSTTTLSSYSPGQTLIRYPSSAASTAPWIDVKPAFSHSTLSSSTTSVSAAEAGGPTNIKAAAATAKAIAANTTNTLKSLVLAIICALLDVLLMLLTTPSMPNRVGGGAPLAPESRNKRSI